MPNRLPKYGLPGRAKRQELSIEDQILVHMHHRVEQRGQVKGGAISRSGRALNTSSVLQTHHEYHLLVASILGLVDPTDE
jgi:hypothetical protein